MKITIIVVSHYVVLNCQKKNPEQITKYLRGMNPVFFIREKNWFR